MLKGIEKGDQVVTAGGLHGKVTGVADDVLTLEIANLKGERVRIKVDRARIERGSVLDPKPQQLRRRLLTAPPQARATPVADGLPVGSARRTGGRRQDGHLEPGVAGQGDERLLPGNAGGADDPDA